MVRRLIRGACIVSVLIVLAGGCSNDDTSDASATTASTSRSPSGDGSTSSTATTARSTTGTLTIEPASARVGASVTLKGRGCAPSDHPKETYLVFVNEGLKPGTIGSVDVKVTSDDDSSFETSFKVPDKLDTTDGSAPTTPGEYDFVSKPPGCHASFRVIG
jgi:hypothetical protein